VRRSNSRRFTAMETPFSSISDRRYDRTEQTLRRPKSVEAIYSRALGLSAYVPMMVA
jgi:hypothetical protein